MARECSESGRAPASERHRRGPIVSHGPGYAMFGLDAVVSMRLSGLEAAFMGQVASEVLSQNWVDGAASIGLSLSSLLLLLLCCCRSCLRNQKLFCRSKLPPRDSCYNQASAFTGRRSALPDRPRHSECRISNRCGNVRASRRAAHIPARIADMPPRKPGWWP